MTLMPASQDFESVRNLAQQICEPWQGAPASVWNEERALPHSLLQALCDADLMALCVPEDLGGAGLEPAALFTLLAELGRVDGSLALAVWAHQCGVLGPLVACDASEARTQALRTLSTHFPPATALLTQPLPFYAPSVGEATPTLLIGTERACLLQSPEQASASRVQLAAGEALVWHRFEGGSGAHVLHQMLSVDVQPMLVCAPRLALRGLSLVALGMLDASIQAAQTYAAERKQFGKAIETLSGVRDLMQRSQAAQIAAQALANAAIGADRPAPLCNQALQHCFEGIDCALQVHGGLGYTRELFIERHLRDTKLCQLLAAQWAPV